MVRSVANDCVPLRVPAPLGACEAEDQFELWPLLALQPVCAEETDLLSACDPTPLPNRSGTSGVELPERGSIGRERGILSPEGSPNGGADGAHDHVAGPDAERAAVGGLAEPGKRPGLTAPRSGKYARCNAADEGGPGDNVRCCGACGETARCEPPEGTGERTLSRAVKVSACLCTRLSGAAGDVGGEGDNGRGEAPRTFCPAVELSERPEAEPGNQSEPNHVLLRRMQSGPKLALAGTFPRQPKLPLAGNPGVPDPKP